MSWVRVLKVSFCMPCHCQRPEQSYCEGSHHSNQPSAYSMRSRMLPLLHLLYAPFCLLNSRTLVLAAPRKEDVDHTHVDKFLTF